MKCILSNMLLILSCIVSVKASQTGTVVGKVDFDGKPLPGVLVTATSENYPGTRNTVTNDLGEFRFVNMIPGTYVLTFMRDRYYTVKRQITVILGAEFSIVVSMTTAQNFTESMLVIVNPLVINENNAELRHGFSRETIEQIPVGETYRDLLKLMPSIANVPFEVRGPNSGGSGQDNRYYFDGVDVTLPLFGTLTAEPTTHDIGQFTVVRGGARAVGFNRSAGFTVNSISKSGTNQLHGNLTLRAEPSSLRASSREGTQPLEGESEFYWANASVGGPIHKERLFYYVSVFAPQEKITNRSNQFGNLPDGKNDRQEIFGKLTFSPSESVTLHGSFRDSHRDVKNETLFDLSGPSVGTSTEIDQEIAILEGNWFITEQQALTVRYNHFNADNGSFPNSGLDAIPNATGAGFDINNLASMGFVQVPNFRNANDGVEDEADRIFNEQARPFIEQYGFTDSNGNLRGGNSVGAWFQSNTQNYRRRAYQIGYDHSLAWGSTTHSLHVGYHFSESGETLQRRNNGWGLISFEGGERFISAEYLQNQGSAPIYSEIQSHNIEFNDTINWGQYVLNLGFIASQDSFFGEGLVNDNSTLSGFRLAPGETYKMYEIDWEDMLQPRLSLVYKWTDKRTAAFSYGRYYPQASSLPRAASWARNQALLRVRSYFDAQGNLVGTENVGSSSGKLFQEDMDPRYIDEWSALVTQEFGAWGALQVNYRYKFSKNYWEDTLNGARLFFSSSSQDPNLPAELLEEKGLYVPDLDRHLEQIGSGSSFVIAQLDGAFTKYHEASLDWETRFDRFYMKATYTWSQYYGNFDQDNTTLNNDINIFLGSSNLADSYGNQVWDQKYGFLRGDRRHLLKVFGNYELPWEASIGALAFYQDGAPWETWNRDFYVQFGFDYSFSNTIRFAEPAGSRREPDHYQVDLRYIQTLYLGSNLKLDLQLDVFNVFNRQTGYFINPVQSSPDYGQPNQFWPGRIVRLGASLSF